jgi:hypothetical protein
MTTRASLSKVAFTEVRGNSEEEWRRERRWRRKRRKGEKGKIMPRRPMLW